MDRLQIPAPLKLDLPILPGQLTGLLIGYLNGVISNLDQLFYKSKTMISSSSFLPSCLVIPRRSGFDSLVYIQHPLLIVSTKSTDTKMSKKA